ncbi:MAG TPA: RidA family protein [Xanthobacteraceae bacterium]|nr:RidA family protein [Xanthobacteraceae bacterium]
MAEIKIYSPPELAKPVGPYNHVAVAGGARLVFIAGQVAVDKSGKLVGEGDIQKQCAQVFANLAAALASAGASWANVVQSITYLVRASDIAGIYEYRLREFPKMFPGGLYPPNTLLVVNRLVNEKYLLEIQAMAAV